MSYDCKINFIIFILYFCKNLNASEVNISAACKWENKNKIPCVEIISSLSNSSTFLNQGQTKL